MVMVSTVRRIIVFSFVMLIPDVSPGKQSEEESGTVYSERDLFPEVINCCVVPYGMYGLFCVHCVQTSDSLKPILYILWQV